MSVPDEHPVPAGVFGVRGQTGRGGARSASGVWITAAVNRLGPLTSLARRRAHATQAWAAAGPWALLS